MSELPIPAPESRSETLAKLRERIVGFAASRYSREAAEDLAQEVMLVLHQKYAHVEAIDELAPLALQIVRFKIAGWRRKVVRHAEHTQVPVEEVPLSDPRQDPATQAERHELLDRLKVAMAQAGERCREIIRLKLEGKTFEEIRVRLNVKSINTIYTWDYRCRQQLLERLGGAWEHTK